MNIFCDWNLFWTGLGAASTFLSLIAAILIYILARNELKKNNEISELDVYFKIKADLNSDSSQKIYLAILENRLLFVRNLNGSVGFEISDGATWQTLPMSQVDVGFLGHVEDLALAYEKGLISLETIMSGYGSLILNSGNSPSIYNYISYLRNEKYHDKDLYSGFEQLYLKIYGCLSESLKLKYRAVMC
ncbi:MAG: hypothetical protein ACK5DD_00940 [Cyclobacteriaceae bacterium]|jgi:hypothetical protein